MSERSVKWDLTVGEVAARSGVPVSTIHFYEGKNLISGWRTAGNQRRFHREVLRRIAVIKVAQRAGVPLASIRQALNELPADAAPNRADWMRLSSRWQADLEARINGLTRLKDQLDGCIGCGCLSTTLCPLRNPDDVLGQESPGPHFREMETGQGHHDVASGPSSLADDCPKYGELASRPKSMSSSRDAKANKDFC